MVRSKQDQKIFETALKTAEEAHGHLCPFLILGVKTALIGIRELGVKDCIDLRVTLMLQNTNFPPCFVDGIQITSKCSIENGKLRIENSPGIAARFELQDKSKVTISVNPIHLDELSAKMKKVMSGNFTPEEFEQMVKLTLSIPEEDFFIIKRK